MLQTDPDPDSTSKTHTIPRGKFHHQQQKLDVQFDPKRVKSCIAKKRGIITWDFSFKGSAKINRARKRVGPIIQSSKTTKKMELSFGRYNEINSPGFFGLCQSFQDHSHLKELTFRLDGLGKTADRALLDLGRGLKRLRHLENVSVLLDECEITDEGFSSLCKKLKTLSSLQKIHIRYIKSTGLKITNKGISSLAACLRRLNFLKSISLNFSGYWQHAGITNSGLQMLCGALKKQTRLQSISVDCSRNTNLSGLGIFSLNETLKELSTLQRINLKFLECHNITEIQPSNFSKLVSLKKLHLDFHNCQNLIKEGLENQYGIIKELVSLQDLSLNFAKCPYIHKICSSIFEQAGNQLNSLRKLNLNFQGYSRDISFSDKDWMILSEWLKKCVFLQDLTLKFSHCHNITDDGFLSFTETLKNLESLQQLRIDSKKCEQITDIGVIALSEALKELTSLQLINLNFEGCRSVTKTGAETLKKSTQGLSSLKKLDVHLSG